MSKQLLTSVFFLICILSLHAQKNKAILTFKDGEILTGLGKLKRDAVKFKSTKDAKSVKYKFNNLEEAKIYYSGEAVTYVYKRVKGFSSPIVVEQVVTGKVSLYKKVINGYTSKVVGGFNKGFGNSGFGLNRRHHYSIKNYYVQRNNKEEMFNLGSNQLFSKNFKKAAADFFKDCPLLVSKIRKKEFRKKHILKIVEFYNQQCN